MSGPRKIVRLRRPLTTKLEVLRRGEKGETRMEICKAMGLPSATVYDILLKADRVKAMAKQAGLFHLLGREKEKGGAKDKVLPKNGKGGHATKKVLMGKGKGVASHKVLTSKVSGTKKVNFKTSSALGKKNAIYSLATKMEVVKRISNGDTMRDIAYSMNIPVSSVYDMKKDSMKIKVAAKKDTALKMLTNKMNVTTMLNDNCQSLMSKAQQERQQQHQKRRPHPLATKLEVVQRAERGEKLCDIGRAMGLAHSTIHFMVKNSKSIKAAAKDSLLLDTNTKVSGRNSEDVVMENMERLLKIWVNEQLCQLDSVSDDTIRKKAVCLWRFVRQSVGSEEAKGVVDNFTASNAWLQQFKERFIYPLSSVIEETKELCSVAEARAVAERSSAVEAKAASETIGVVETWAAAHTSGPRQLSPPIVEVKVGMPRGFSSLLRAKVEVAGYTPRQVLNVDEMGLFWRKPLASTLLSVDEQACQGSRDQFSLMFGANAAGDLKLKPLLVYHTENPRSLMGYIKEYLPVIWRSSAQGRVVPALCQNYVVEYVSPRCREYAAEHGLQNRFLLLVDNSAAFPHSMDDWADNIEVMFVPTMSKSVVQPMENGITAAFKLHYLHRLLAHLLRETEGEDKESVLMFWLNYNVRKALNNISMAWDDVSATTLNAAWLSIWPECVYSLPGNKLASTPSELDVVTLAHKVGFLQVTVEDVQDLLRTTDEDATTSDYFQLELDQTMEGHSEVVDSSKTLDMTLLRHVLSLFEEAMAVLEDNDPNCTRSCDMRGLVEEGIKSYRELYTTKKRKAKNTSIFYPTLE
ncbi:tigger transposable element-derived protein 1-like [Portunus trituberculatus]|uniref:Tigger transposable element-derived protein 1 n=1 Tax=Portunus trituberculatus TaxID=210409 RepID=A0A5B7GPG0_PORTR|nr:tigger transposable element-derived protein 1-like [Portunus trituberculatus]XP_045134124.1 tigger transposable element-derived protein 1-like [Portunus trituberculatus]XP_045134135.1 tigger transposable element-derived protein 1-like [Portunus trituberculatus]XP_045134143.1 tigger transposable element-derived protein 1-like [Portunus trituberculatus]MPC59509.1 Tigger transposable element-derived protein 1 [Portunus trituberculatus]